MAYLSRRDFLKLGTSAIAGLGLSPFLPGLGTFDDSHQVRVATKVVTIHSGASDQNRITSQRFRDELVNIYEEVDGGARTTRSGIGFGVDMFTAHAYKRSKSFSINP